MASADLSLPKRPAQNLHTPLLQQRSVKTLTIFRALQVGDMLCAVPAMRALRGALPNARITLVGLAWAEQFARRFSNYIDDFITFPGHPAFPEQAAQEALVPLFYEEMRNRNFDLAIQMHGSGQISNRIVKGFNAKASAGYVEHDEGKESGNCFIKYPETGPEPLRLLQLVEFLGAPSAGTHLEFPITGQDRHELKLSGLDRDLVPNSYICIHPGARIRDKCWPPQCFAQIADRLASEFDCRIVLTGSAKEADLTSAVAAHMRHRPLNAASSISLGAMAALMSGSRLLVCNDTGVSHIAAGLKLPSVVIFSKADMQRWAPLDQQLHRCIWDPQARHVDEALAQARLLLATAGAAK
jgi:ADP-heptose:LPS heptosyltransferase